MPTVDETTDASAIPAYRRDAEAVVMALRSDAARGLCTEEARHRLIDDGANRIPPAPPMPAWRRFLVQFHDALVGLLLVATAIAVALWIYERDTTLPYEAIAIFTIVGLNAVLGNVQEVRADRAVEALRALTAPTATVIRDGARRSIPAADLVPGDLILLEEGDTIPADARLLRSVALRVAEASLTGESEPVAKDPAALTCDAGVGDRANMVFSGTTVTYGRGEAVVTATGAHTEFGRIAGMLARTPRETTPLQAALDRTGKLLGIVVLAIAAVMVGTILLTQEVGGFRTFLDVLILGVALAVAAVPEGLAAIVTVVLAIGVQRMARRNAIVRRLPAVETLGCATVIASDKTGTLTRNEMTVRAIVTASGRVDAQGGAAGALSHAGQNRAERPLQHEVARTLRAALLANNATLIERDGRREVQGDPTEIALLVAAREAGIDEAEIRARFARIGELPFSSERKRMSTIHRDAEHDHIRLFAKGAPDILLTRCANRLVGDAVRPMTPSDRAAVESANEALAGEGLRTLALASRVIPDAGSVTVDDEAERDLVFLGLVGMLDPPRPETAAAVARVKAAGIRPLLITGDHPQTALAIAREVGIAADGQVVTGAALAALEGTDLLRVLRAVAVYARVDPEQKLKIVRALQADGQVVAMTGDGVNDAPALKAADIGIAMGIAGTDVSREVADLVLADDNFASIVAAVEEGRAIFANIRASLRYLLSSNIGEVMTMFCGIFLADLVGLSGHAHGGLALPLLATQILWINLLTDGPPALALGIEPTSGGVMRRPPRGRTEGIVTRRMWADIAVRGTIMAAGTLVAFDAALAGGVIPGTGDLPYARTMAFTTLVLFQLCNAFGVRTGEAGSTASLRRSRSLWGACLLSGLLQVAALYVPILQNAFGTVALGVRDWLLCAAVASAILWLPAIGARIARSIGRIRRTPVA